MAVSGKSVSRGFLRLEWTDLLAKAVALSVSLVNGALELEELLTGLARSRVGGVERNIAKLQQTGNLNNGVEGGSGSGRSSKRIGWRLGAEGGGGNGGFEARG